MPSHMVLGFASKLALIEQAGRVEWAGSQLCQAIITNFCREIKSVYMCDIFSDQGKKVNETQVSNRVFSHLN